MSIGYLLAVGAGVRSAVFNIGCTLALPIADAGIAEKWFGLANSASNFVAVTLGTGVGGGYRPSRGSQFLADAIGHITVETGGLPCTCGQSRCLEVYANAAALVCYAGPPFVSAAEVAGVTKEGETAAREAVRTYAGYLARGLSAIVHLLDPELIALSGGVAEGKDALLGDLSQHMSRQVIGWTQRPLCLALSNVACFGGVMGASAVALDEFDRRARANIR
jgi:predicted NBD/HSP70 family sugar kinase